MVGHRLRATCGARLSFHGCVESRSICIMSHAKYLGEQSLFLMLIKIFKIDFLITFGILSQFPLILELHSFQAWLLNEIQIYMRLSTS